MNDKFQAERDYETQYVAEELEFFADLLGIKKDSNQYSMLKHKITWIYRDAWTRGSDYRTDEMLGIMKEDKESR